MGRIPDRHDPRQSVFSVECEGSERPSFSQRTCDPAAHWGEITYTGPKLSTYEEDSLLVLLACLEMVSKHRSETTDKDGRKTYTYRGPALPLLRALGYKQPNAKDYKRLIESLRLLTVAGVDLRVSSRPKNGGEKEPRFTSMSAMLANVSWDNKDKVLSATINPFFYEAYLAGTVTLMDVAKRMSLSGTIARSFTVSFNLTGITRYFRATFLPWPGCSTWTPSNQDGNCVSSSKEQSLNL